jgi:hypothetical protein
MLFGGVAQGLLKLIGNMTLPGKGTRMFWKNTLFAL